MPAIDFIHYALGELLGIEYVVDPSARQRTPVTLSTGGLQSPRPVVPHDDAGAWSERLVGRCQ